jgi:hypothetical protein
MYFMNILSQTMWLFLNIYLIVLYDLFYIRWYIVNHLRIFGTWINMNMNIKAYRAHRGQVPQMTEQDGDCFK